MIADYRQVAPKADIALIQRLGERFAGRTFLHVNSTREGGGVAEILHRMLPILRDLGIEDRWEVIKGDVRFFDITKKIHNALQGNREDISAAMWEYYRETNKKNAAKMN